MDKINGAIFEDLEIDKSQMLSDPAKFAATLLEKADELAKICKSDTSVQKRAQQIKDSAKDATTPPEYIKALNAIYTGACDDLSLPEVLQLIDSVKDLVKDLENEVWDRTRREATMENSTVANKRLAHYRYVTLRKAYESFRNFNKVFNPEIKLPILPALPGNYGGGLNTMTHYLFTINGDVEAGEFSNWRVIARKAGLEGRFNTLMDFLEWAGSEENEIIEVREVIK